MGLATIGWDTQNVRIERKAGAVSFTAPASKQESGFVGYQVKPKKGRQNYKKNVVVQSYLVIAPQIIGFFIFSIYPIYWVLQYSFTDYNGERAHFVGLANYIKIFLEDHTYWMTVGNIFVLTVMKMLLELPMAFVLAMLLCNKSLRAKRFFNTMLFLPSVIGVASAGMIFSYIFRTYNGFINNLLVSLGMISAPVSWLGEKWTAMLVITFMSTWMTFPINMMYFCSAISGVPQEVLESARLDGCGGIRKIFTITLPMIAPAFKVILMLAINGTMKMMNEVMVLTGGGPQGKTNVVMLYLYNLFFGMGTSESARIGYASAGSIIFTAIIGIITVFYLMFTRKADELY